MIHSRGEIGGCWGHDPKANIRVHADRRPDRLRALSRRAREVVPQGVRRLRQQLQPQPAVAAVELCAGPAVEGGATQPRQGLRWRCEDHRRNKRGCARRSRCTTYSPRRTRSTSRCRTAGSTTRWPGSGSLALLPAPGPGVGPVVDAGCGVGRWARMLIDRGYRVVGIEQSPGMLAELDKARLGPGFRLVRGSMETADVSSRAAWLSVRRWSSRWARCSTPADPGATVARLASWLAPGASLGRIGRLAGGSGCRVDRRRARCGGQRTAGDPTRCLARRWSSLPICTCSTGPGPHLGVRGRPASAT